MNIIYNTDLLLQYPIYVYSTHGMVMYIYVYLCLLSSLVLDSPLGWLI